MRLAVSSLAWSPEDDAAVIETLVSHGVTGVEMAPTKVWPRPLEATEAEVRTYRATFERRGLQVVALQAILFGRPDLTVFETAERRADTVAYLDGMCRLAGWLGAGVLVFGSPKNRLVGATERDEVHQIAVEFFREVGENAARHDTAVCIEANPPEYGCDFITRTADAAALVAQVSHAGFGLHLDAGGMALSGDRPELVARLARTVRHYHISEPHLEPTARGRVNHAGFAAAVRSGGYDGWASIEMKPVPGVPAAEAVGRAVDLAQELYGLRP